VGEGADPKRGEARFFVRIDNLRFWLELVAKRLGDLAHRLSAGVGVEELDLLLLTIIAGFVCLWYAPTAVERTQAFRLLGASAVAIVFLLAQAFPTSALYDVVVLFSTHGSYGGRVRLTNLLGPCGKRLTRPRAGAHRIARSGAVALLSPSTAPLRTRSTRFEAHAVLANRILGGDVLHRNSHKGRAFNTSSHKAVI